MDDELTPAARASLTPYLERARLFAREARARNTIRAYRSDWERFERFCHLTSRVSLPAAAETVAAYAADAAERLKARTVERHLASISRAHQLAGFESPTQEVLTRAVMSGIRRVKGTAQSSKNPISPEILRSMLAAHTDRGLTKARDRALLLVGFAGGFRRSELVALHCEDVEWTGQGIIVTIRRSKTDAEGEGSRVGIPMGEHLETCPVRALRCWLDESGIGSGSLFRPVNRWSQKPGEGALCGHQVARIVKKLATSAGLDPAVFSGHSLRSGFATAAAEGGASERAIMDQTRHKSLQQVRRYIKRGRIFQGNAASFLGF